MLIKTFILAAIVALTLYSEGTNAKINTANKCTLGLLPFAENFPLNQSPQHILKAFAQKGYYVTVLNAVNEIPEVEFISNAEYECVQTYFGTHSKTSVKIINTASNEVINISTSKISSLAYDCRLEIIKAINGLPNCKIK